MAALSVLYNPYPFPGNPSSSPHSLLPRSQLAMPLAPPSLLLITDLGCVLSADETVLTTVLRHIAGADPLAPAEVAALLLRMANAEPVADVASQVLL